MDLLSSSPGLRVRK
jgi:hypothetical protein